MMLTIVPPLELFASTVTLNVSPVPVCLSMKVVPETAISPVLVWVTPAFVLMVSL